MALQISDTFDYRGKKPNFARDQFATLAEMCAYPEANIPEGFVTYCIETGKRYQWKSENTSEVSLGKWRLASDVNIVLLEETDADIALNNYDDDTFYFIYEPITYTLVAKPVNATMYADGTLYTLPATDAYKVTGTGGTDIGVYVFTVKLNTAYKWEDGTRDVLTIVYTVVEKPVMPWMFGDTFPIRFAGTWHFGDTFPIMYT
jgi:hypothetical protein